MKQADIELYREARVQAFDLCDFLLLAADASNADKAHSHLTTAIDAYHRVGSMLQIIHEKIHAGADN